MRNVGNNPLNPPLKGGLLFNLILSPFSRGSWRGLMTEYGGQNTDYGICFPSSVFCNLIKGI